MPGTKKKVPEALQTPTVCHQIQRPFHGQPLFLDYLTEPKLRPQDSNPATLPMAEEAEDRFRGAATAPWKVKSFPSGYP